MCEQHIARRPFVQLDVNRINLQIVHNIMIRNTINRYFLILHRNIH